MAAAHLIDLTRLVSRQGKGALTGVDRVELAWLDHLLTRDTPLFALLRTVPGYLLLERAGAARVADLAHGRAVAGANDLIGLLTRWRDPARGRAEAALRRIAIARVAPNGLARALRAAMPQGGIWLNMGHTNLTERSFAAVRAAGQLPSYAAVQSAVVGIRGQGGWGILTPAGHGPWGGDCRSPPRPSPGWRQCPRAGGKRFYSRKLRALAFLKFS